ncbi:tRNA (N6-isopentenyl adenosine(37)-C2)-methylthiotransferase MiaB [Candidatus Borkfalkia ceftriaxoniphila]|uniref:tRNA-2-methylthio-N(6)-dimethylallyladenosine synthase n=1 Tax=Candidatus Borkfalkia ceftriaxoniphila TaxID=2508949 RepID=A0A4Q2K995_9FIRM|nr:tRNA (N6-isopentenyl adenosine(37)-C2)-methylthiotransferase MiaB [Candidatus Borkfalkia ceftriaxoniphila]RXZ58156.1 tRNA (N6-isopentenyl adenosine(37)-C2)-methylthiotransferase MiaB [Candidatus Borkfalkia ceftriaxoniphila]
MNEKHYHIITYGCQMNVHESEKIAGTLKKMGYEPVADSEDADIVVFNTCCIRENAENHAYGNIGALKKLKKSKKDLLIAVGGCMTQQPGKAEELKKKFPFVDIVFGTHNLDELQKLVELKLKRKKSVVDVWEKEGEISEKDKPFRTSYPNAWVNIMYGCNNFCTYCIVPYVRGRERSRRPEHIVAEVRSLLDEGYKEITLLGQNVNSYGNDADGAFNFPDLLREICQDKRKFRLRFMTSNPKDFTEDLVAAIAENPQICRLVHLPVQAGSDRILQKMNRKYTFDEYLDKVKMLRKRIPDCQITTDIMVGFPTETEEDFQKTLDLVDAADFSTAFTFVYSRRSGTVAAEMEGQIPEDVQKDRIMRLVSLVNSKTREKSKEYLGKIVEILCEDYDGKKGVYLGRDEYGRMGYFPSSENVVGKFVNVKITEASGVSLTGEIVR